MRSFVFVGVVLLAGIMVGCAPPQPSAPPTLKLKPLAAPGSPAGGAKQPDEPGNSTPATRPARPRSSAK